MVAFVRREIKLRLPEGAADGSALLSDPALKGAVTEDFETLYYDTEDLRLLASNLAYIVNVTPEGCLGEINPTDSLEDGIFAMEDWYRPQSGPGPELEVFRDLNVWPRLEAAAVGRDLVLLFSARFRRSRSILELEDGGRSEILLDAGVLAAGSRRETLAELKLILLSGQADSLERISGEFSSRYSLVPEYRTKHRRGLDLAGLRP